MMLRSNGGRPAPEHTYARQVRRRRVAALVGLAPALITLTILFGGAVVLAAMRSLGVGGLAAVGTSGDGPSLDAYHALFADPEFGRSLLATLHVAATSTALSVVLGVAAALVLRRVVHGRNMITTAFQLSLPLPHLVGAVAVLALIGQSGLLSRLATQAGLIDAPGAFPALVFDPYGIGIITQYVWKEIPFVGIVALAVLRASGNDLEEAASSLGASPWQRVRHVVLPVVVPGVLPVAVIIFAFTFGAFEVPLLLGRSHPALLPVLAHRRYTEVDLAARPAAMAISVIITLIVVLVVVVGAALTRRTIRPEPR